MPCCTYRSYSKLLAFEASRILFRLGCDVRIYDPAGLPVKDDVQHNHPKVQELRDLSRWSDGHVWISPEQHGTLVSSLINTRVRNQTPLTGWDIRQLFSKTKSTGFPSPSVPSAQLKAAHSQSPKSQAVRNRSTQ